MMLIVLGIILCHCSVVYKMHVYCFIAKHLLDYSQAVLKEVLKDYLITMCFVYLKVCFAFK